MGFNWTQVNVPTILSVAAAAYGIITYVNNIDNRATAIEKGYAAIGVQMEKLENVPFRVEILEAGVKNNSERIDRIGEAVVNGIGEVRKDIGMLGTKVEVLTTRMEDVIPRRRTEAEHPAVPRRN